MKVLKKQTNSKDCFICGIENKLGVNASFYEMEDGKLYSLFKFGLHPKYNTNKK